MIDSAANFIENVSLRVSDVERSAEFYADLVGLRVSSSNPDRALLADPADAMLTRLELIRAEQPGRAPIRAAGLYHVAFLYPGRRGLGAAVRRIAAGSYEFVGASDHGVSEALYVQDPDNLGIELYRDRPRDDWPMAGERVAMVTEPLALAPIAAEADEGDAQETAAGVGIGHVHLRVADLETARSFWIGKVGFELMAELPGALFMAAGGYHHHIGANTWQSAGAAPARPAAPGLESIRLRLEAPAGKKTATPEDVTVEIF